MAIQIGKYKRPGIFIEEFDNSIIQTPLVEGITNLVIGVSRKGPVNTPVRLNSVSDLEAVFGPIDRGLERKESYFHRTVAKMLESSPVFAMNLLRTDDRLDTLEYQSLSVSSDYSNDVERRAPFRRFHDTTGFWKKDTEAFLDIAKLTSGSSNRLLNITNISDKMATVFIIKSQLSGFDRTLIEWYGSVEKVPTYVNPIDWASDYLVDVVVVSGDWADYASLSLDQRWQKYFSVDGLRKNLLREFINDRNVTTLGYYQGLSLIPYFRDTNGRNIFIETVLNRDTDKTGIFCAFNSDDAEKDFFNGRIDLVGHTIAAKNETNINFLSYKEDVVEEVPYSVKPLDTPGNVFALMGTQSNLDHFYGLSSSKIDGVYGYQDNPTNTFHRTAWYGEGNIFGVSFDSASGTLLLGATRSGNQIAVTYKTRAASSTSHNPYAIINDNYVPLIAGTTYSLLIGNDEYLKLAYTASYYAAFGVDQFGNFKSYKTTKPDTYPSVPTNDLVLSYIKFEVSSGTFSGIFSHIPVSLNSDTTTTGAFDRSFLDLTPTPYGITSSRASGSLTLTAATFSGFYKIEGTPVDYVYMPATFYSKYDPTALTPPALQVGQTNNLTNVYGEITIYAGSTITGAEKDIRSTNTNANLVALGGGLSVGDFIKYEYFQEGIDGVTASKCGIGLVTSVEHLTVTLPDGKPDLRTSIKLSTSVVGSNNLPKGNSPINLWKISNSKFDYSIDLMDWGSLRINFFNTNIKTNDVMGYDYTQLRKIKMFNKLVSLLDSPNKNKMVMLLGPGQSGNENLKFPLQNMTISNIVNDSGKDKSFVLNTGLTENLLQNVLNGFLCLYKNDNEFILGTKGFRSTPNGPIRDITNASTISVGVAGHQSKFYLDYYNGIINLNDYSYSNLLNGTGTMSVMFFRGEDPALTTGLTTGVTSSFAGYDYIMLSGDENVGLVLDDGDSISIKDSVINNSTIKLASSDYSSLFNKVSVTNGVISIDPTPLTNTYIYRVGGNVNFEFLPSVNYINNLNEGFTHFLKMYITNDYDLKTSDLNVEFKDSTLEIDSPMIKDDGLLINPNLLAMSTFYVYSQDSNYKQSLEIETPEGYVRLPNKVLVDAARYTEVVKGDWLDASIDSSKLKVGEYPRKMTRIVDKKLYAKDRRFVELTCDSSINVINLNGDLQTTRYKTVDVYAQTYKAISLKGFVLRDASLPDGTEIRQNQILGVVGKGTPLFKALTNKEAIDFRYLIDSFGLGLIEKSKQQLVDICGDRKDSFGFLNMPSIKTYKKSVSPSFIKDGVISAEFIAKGGDDSTGPLFQYSFGDGEGSTCVGYFLPYLKITENGRPMDVPPASYVATTYMRKHGSGLTGITPWTIAAGVTNGRITGIDDLEMDFTNDDIEFLNQAQINPIVFKRNRGNVIETENTAQTIYKSALSYIHVREVLIELERELSRMLLDFQWNYNTADIRAEIKLRADLICETYVSRNGLYNYFNKMDEENNTNEIIDNQIGVLDTYVEPIKGMGIIVNNITILRTGAIAAGGFQ